MTRLSNINTILAFVTVAREGSVSRAAEVLNLTQPAVSHQIKRLADEMGLALFERTATGLALSSDGAAILPKAERVLETLAEFRLSARQRSGQLGGRLRVGTIVDPEFIRLGRLLALLRREHPAIETELVHGVSGDILSWLRKGRIDAGFYLCSPDDLPRIDIANGEPITARKLATFRYHVVGPVGWEAKIAQADWRALARLPWIGTPPTSVHNRLLAKVFHHEERQRTVVARVDQEASMLEMVRSGLGLSLCRDSIALHQRQTFGLSVCETVSVPACLCFITLESRRDIPTIAETFRLLEQAW
ncbi:LysR family transcriptional regulator [Pacificoceanicola onchidii]|uniref:LysR family transcriptional regulator n=1 Tax=Pacificoceanicola onchidii TaxID=2562685 RepID=UPI0010A2B89C|nr:LysR family transcriptional regulator [Pacificoceanicola onchidii]